MPAIVLAAVTAPKMIGRGKNSAALPVVIEIRRSGILSDFLIEQIEELVMRRRDLRMISEAIEAASTQARPSKFLRYKLLNVEGHRGPVTPALSLVSVACCNPTAIGAAADPTAVFAVNGRDLIPQRG